MIRRVTRLLINACVFAACPVLLAACATQGPRMAIPEPAPTPFPDDARVFDAESGTAMDPAVLPAMIEKADIVVIGERHDDAVGHAVELAVVDQFLRVHPRGAVALEMLERHEQHLVEAYLDGRMCTAGFVEQTGSASWAPEGKWNEWYQPVIDRVRAEPKARLIAANAPRRYVSQVRQEGFEVVQNLPALERPMVDLPLDDDVEPYRARFFDTMKSHHHGSGGEGGHHMPALTDEQIEPFYRSQRVWDATMAASVANAAARGRPVLLIVGAFHTDEEGGLISEIRARMPRAHLLTMSLVPNNEAQLTDEDRVRARLVVYTPKADDEQQKDQDDESDDSSDS